MSELCRERIRAVRAEHERWGAPKLAWLLEQRYGEPELPSVSTIGRVLRESGLSRTKRRVRAHGTALEAVEEPNQGWAIDFKRWRRTGDGARCEPLTVSDQATRYLLCCQALPSTNAAEVRARLERVFAEYGLPERMRSDKGSPFAMRGECGLMLLSVWWIALGIPLERIEPGHPQQNGRHERLHRTLHEETMQPPAATLRQHENVWRCSGGNTTSSVRMKLWGNARRPRCMWLHRARFRAGCRSRTIPASGRNARFPTARSSAGRATKYL